MILAPPTTTKPASGLGQAESNPGFWIGMGHLLLLMGVVLWLDREHRK